MASFVQAKRRDPLRGYKFRVTDMSKGALLGGFNSVTGLRKEIEVVNYREGEDGAVVRKLPGLTEFPNIVLQKGMSENTSLQEWSDEVYRIHGDNTLPADDVLRRNIRIVLLNREGVITKAWRVEECWPAIYEIGDLDAESSDVLMERVELANEGHYLETLSPFVA